MLAFGRPSPSRVLVLALCAAVVLPAVATPTRAAAEETPAAGDTVVGELVRTWAEHEDPADAVGHADEGPLSWIETAPGEAVRVPTEDVEDIEVGATVQAVLGDEVADPASAEPGVEPALEVLEADVVAEAPSDPPVSAATTGVTNAVTVVMVVPAGGAADGRTWADVTAAVNGPVADFWSEQSGGTVRVGVTGTATGWLQATVGCNAPYELWRQAAASVSWVPGANRHLLVYLPQSSTSCAYGLAEVGSSVTTGGRLYARDIGTSVLAHELGHNFGLGHASARQCDGVVDSGSCRTTGYYDWYDVMGISWDRLGSLGAPHAARLGLLPAGSAPTVSAGSAAVEHTLAPVGARTGTRAVRLVDGDGDVYWLEYRTPTGRDSWLGTSADWRRLQTGVLLRRTGAGDDTSLLLDGTPSAAVQWDADGATALPTGRSVSFGEAPFRVTVLEASASGARVVVMPTRPRTPVGNWDSLAASGSAVTVSGWTFDPDSPAAPAAVHLYVDGGGTALVADRSRPDVGAVFPEAGANHGFSWTGALAPGVHRVCVYAIDSEQPWTNTAFGCRFTAV